MKPFIIRCIVLFSVCLMQSAIAAKPVLNIEHWKTTQGVPVYFVASKQLPMVDIRLAFNAGAARDDALPGLAQVTNAMLGEATSTDDADTIAAKFDHLGALFSSSLGRDNAVISLRTLTKPSVMNTALTTFNKVITDAQFPEKNLLRIKNQVLLSQQENKQDPGQIASNAFYQAIYQHRGYGHPVLGNADSVNKITASDVEQFYHRYYVANNATMVIVGDLNQSKAKQIAEQITQGMTPGHAATPLPKAAPQKASKTKKIPFPSTQTTILLGQVGINRQNKAYFPLYVGNHVLGSGVFTARLFKTVRVKNGLVYGVYSYFLPLQANGPFIISLKTRNQKANDALSLTHAVLTTFVAQGPTENELNAAKQNIIGSFSLRFSSNAAIADNLVTMAFYHLPLDYFDTFRDNINAVSVDDIRDAFAKTVTPNKITTVLVGKI
jgi:zinc protease